MTTVDDLSRHIAQLAEQQALQTQALRRILEGNWLGPDGAAADVDALLGGNVADFRPQDFPKATRRA